MRPSALLLDDARFDRHAANIYHPERPERLVAARAAIGRADVAWQRVDARASTSDELVRVHDPSFVEALEKLRDRSCFVDADTYVAPESVHAAQLAAGGTVALIDEILSGATPRGVALVRPPGHHARPGQMMGFCLLNNVAVAAAHARARGLDRVAIIDWDVHHGNGTQEIFWRDPHVLYISTHQFPFYPGTGGVDEQGEGDGKGFTVNVPLTAGGDDGVYRAAFEQIVLPVLESYAPELVIVSAGFDAAARDPLAEMDVSDAAFGWMATELAKVADKFAAGRMALVLEGGYDLRSLEDGLLAAVTGMLEKRPTRMPAAKSDHEDIERASGHLRASWPVE